MVDGAEGAVRTTDDSFGHSEAFEGLGGGYFVDQVAIDVEEGGHAVVVYYVVVPDFVVEGSWRGVQLGVGGGGELGVGIG